MEGVPGAEYGRVPGPMSGIGSKDIELAWLPLMLSTRPATQ